MARGLLEGVRLVRREPGAKVRLERALHVARRIPVGGQLTRARRVVLLVHQRLRGRRVEARRLGGQQTRGHEGAKELVSEPVARGGAFGRGHDEVVVEDLAQRRLEPLDGRPDARDRKGMATGLAATDIDRSSASASAESTATRARRTSRSRSDRLPEPSSPASRAARSSST